MDTWVNLALGLASSLLLLSIDVWASARFPAKRRLLVVITAGVVVICLLFSLSWWLEESRITIHAPVIDVSLPDATSYEVGGTFIGKGSHDIYLLARKHKAIEGQDQWPNIWTVITLVEDVDEARALWRGKVNLRTVDGHITMGEQYDVVVVLSSKTLTPRSRLPYQELRQTAVSISNLLSLRIEIQTVDAGQTSMR